MPSFENALSRSLPDIDAERNALTLQAYEIGAHEYEANTLIDRSEDTETSFSTRQWIYKAMFLRDQSPEIAHLPILEIGSATGRDAAYIERYYGVRVIRTDATTAFVERLQSQGHDARTLNALTDDLGGPYSMVFANGVVPHFSDKQALNFISRAVDSLVRGGILAFSVKTTLNDEREGWDAVAPPTEGDLLRKMQSPRYNYIRRPYNIRGMIRRATQYDQPLRRAVLYESVPCLTTRSRWAGIIALRSLPNEAYPDVRN